MKIKLYKYYLSAHYGKKYRYMYADSEETLGLIVDANCAKIEEVSGVFAYFVFYCYCLFSINTYRTQRTTLGVIREIVAMLNAGVDLDNVTLNIQKDLTCTSLQRQFAKMYYLLRMGVSPGDAAKQSLLFLPESFFFALTSSSTVDQIHDSFRHLDVYQRRKIKLRSFFTIQLLIFMPLVLGIVMWIVLETSASASGVLLGYRTVVRKAPVWYVSLYYQVFDFGAKSIITIIAAAFIIIALFAVLGRIKSIKSAMLRFCSRLPFIRAFVRVPATLKFLSAIKGHLDSGENIFLSINKSLSTLGNSLYYSEMARLVSRVEKGESITNCLGDINFLSSFEKSTLINGIQSDQVAQNITLLLDILESRYKILIKMSEFLVRLFFISLIVILIFWYYAVDLRLARDFGVY